MPEYLKVIVAAAPTAILLIWLLHSFNRAPSLAISIASTVILVALIPITAAFCLQELSIDREKQTIGLRSYLAVSVERKKDEVKILVNRSLSGVYRCSRKEAVVLRVGTHFGYLTGVFAARDIAEAFGEGVLLKEE